MPHALHPTIGSGHGFPKNSAEHAIQPSRSTHHHPVCLSWGALSHCTPTTLLLYPSPWSAGARQRLPAPRGPPPGACGACASAWRRPWLPDPRRLLVGTARAGCPASTPPHVTRMLELVSRERLESSCGLWIRIMTNRTAAPARGYSTCRMSCQHTPTCHRSAGGHQRIHNMQNTGASIDSVVHQHV